MSAIFVVIEFTGYWIHATGAGGGEDVDLVADRDADGFPVLRGRHVRGILREASRRVETWKRTPWSGKPPLTEILFGKRPRPGEGESLPGCLDIRDFRVPDAVRRDAELQVAFFRRVASTRIEDGSGTAADETLRAIEAVTPCPLGGWISWAPEDRLLAGDIDENTFRAASSLWIDHLKRCLVEARSFGASRTRGYGRTRFSAEHHVHGESRP